MKREVIRTRNFVSDAAEFVLRHARNALAERDQFRIALSGGKTPRAVYAELARIGVRPDPPRGAHYDLGR